MPSFLRNFEPFSFWLGFLVATLFWWILGRFAPVFREFWKNFVDQAQTIRENAKAGVEYHYRNDVIRITQTMHLGAPLFSLNEVIIPPRLMSTPPNPGSGTDSEGKFWVDITLDAIPYMPDWPELSAAFNTPTYSLSEALEKGTHLVLTGYAGSGKTVALAHLAGLIAKSDPEVGELSERLPILVHFGNLPKAEMDANHPVNTLLAALSPQVSARTNAKLASLLEKSFAQNRVLLMIDGMDEVNQEEFIRAAGFIETILNLFPGTQVVATASPFYFDGLPQLGLVPVAMAAWDDAQREAFVKNWGTKWTQHIQRTVWNISPNGKGETVLQMEPEILNNWLRMDNLANTPLEMTLKTWAAYAGDARGPSNVNAIEAYIRRMAVNIHEGDTALERVALQISLKELPFPTLRSAIRWARGTTVEDAEESIIPEATSETASEEVEESGIKPGSVSRQAIPELLASGILVHRADSKLGFVHPTIGGYCAGKALASAGGSSWVQNQPAWMGKQQALQYLAHFGTPLGVTNSLGNAQEDLIRHQLLFAARWLPESLSHPKAAWRIGLMRELFNLIGSRSISIGLRARAMTALLLSKDPGIPQMCKRLLEHEEPDVRQVAILGLGVLKDQKSITELGEMLYEADPGVHQAASLALVAIGTQAALEAVATAMLHGDENHQRACAEALANDAPDGHPVLKEASTFDDLLARRAAVYGLARVRESWAREIIEGMRTQDKEWIVRNAAEEIAKQLDQGTPYIPGPTPPLHESGWLLLFAAKSGEGVSPGTGAEEILQRALVGGTDSERIAAMYQLKFISPNAGESAISILYGIFLQAHDDMQEAAYLALWHMALTGAVLPSPIKFGIGTQNW